MARCFPKIHTSHEFPRKFIPDSSESGSGLETLGKNCTLYSPSCYIVSTTSEIEGAWRLQESLQELRLIGWRWLGPMLRRCRTISPLKCSRYGIHRKPRRSGSALL